MKTTGEGIGCRVCGRTDHSVKDSRGGPSYWRRRRACKCGERFSTVEFYAADMKQGIPHLPALDLQRKLNAMPERQRKLIEHLIWEFGPHKEAAPLPDGVDAGVTDAHPAANP